MLYPTLNQPLVLLIIFIVGLFSGLIFDVTRIITTLLGNRQWLKHFLDFIAVTLSFLLLFLANLSINLGRFRIYILFVFILSFSLERLFSKKLWTKLLSKWYTSITKKKEVSSGEKEVS